VIGEENSQSTNPPRLFDEPGQKVSALCQALVEGETSGAPVPFAMASIIEEAHQETTGGSVDVAQAVCEVRRQRADFDAFDRLMQRQGGEPPQPDDLIP
jgi:hypothetical protein